MSGHTSAPGNWEKVLWRGQDWPDNYVPPSLFLASLRRNPNIQLYKYWPLVILTCAISQHLATIFIFLSIFVRLKENALDPRTLVCLSIGLFLTGYGFWSALLSRKNGSKTVNHLKTLKSSIMMFLVLMSLSPVLRTLTAATSSDSIWALAAILFILNALLADYRPVNPKHEAQEGLSSVLSMNAAVSASVVLASRLPTNLSVFALVLFAIQAFALYPVLRQRLQPASTTTWVLITAILSSTAIYLVVDLSCTVLWIYSAVLGFVTFGAPAILIWAQRYKNVVRGPWDAAVPRVKEKGA